MKDEKSYKYAFYIILILQILVLSYVAIFHLGKNKEYKVYITEKYSLTKEDMENDEDFILSIKNEFKTGYHNQYIFLTVLSEKMWLLVMNMTKKKC